MKKTKQLSAGKHVLAPAKPEAVNAWLEQRAAESFQEVPDVEIIENSDCRIKIVAPKVDQFIKKHYQK